MNEDKDIVFMYIEELYDMASKAGGKLEKLSEKEKDIMLCYFISHTVALYREYGLKKGGISYMFKLLKDTNI